MLLAAIAILAVAVRWRGDEFIESASLGVTADWLKGPGVPLRLTFRREDYLVAWLRVNPRADFSESGARQMRETKPDFSVDPLIYSRIIPAGSLAVALILIGLHQRYLDARDVEYFVPVVLLSTLGGLAVGGIVYPPIFYAVGVHGRHLPFYMKATAAFLAIAGFAAGCHLLFVL
jgi:hypothetical protein